MLFAVTEEVLDVVALAGDVGAGGGPGSGGWDPLCCPPAIIKWIQVGLPTSLRLHCLPPLPLLVRLPPCILSSLLEEFLPVQQQKTRLFVQIPLCLK